VLKDQFPIKKIFKTFESSGPSIDEPSHELRKLLNSYYQEKNVIGLRKDYDWVPESVQEKEKYKALLGEEFEKIMTPFYNFHTPKF
jgi:hypothetical protein